jgi:hypothetical protein
MALAMTAVMTPLGTGCNSSNPALQNITAIPYRAYTSPEYGFCHSGGVQSTRYAFTIHGCLRERSASDAAAAGAALSP